MSNIEKPDKNFLNLLKQEFEAFEGKFELLEDNSGVKISIGEVFGVRNNRITVIYKAMERMVAFNKNFHDQILETLSICRLAFYSHWDFQCINQNAEDVMRNILQDKNVGFWVAFRVFRYIFAKGYHHIDFIDHGENDPCCFAIKRYGTYMYFLTKIVSFHLHLNLILLFYYSFNKW